jgi:hypothetical protein
MSCDIYVIGKTRVAFTDSGDSGCVCCWPNDYLPYALESEIVRNLAYLGAAVKFLRDMENPPDCLYLPFELPIEQRTYIDSAISLDPP